MSASSSDEKKPGNTPVEIYLFALHVAFYFAHFPNFGHERMIFSRPQFVWFYMASVFAPNHSGMSLARTNMDFSARRC
jgi:hypothetical protein